MSEIEKHSTGHAHGDAVHVPANTAWPTVMAFGLTLAFAGILLGIWIAVLGLILCLVSAIGWFRQVLPHEAGEHVHVAVEPFVVETKTSAVERIELPLLEHKPGELVPHTTLVAGLKGGIFGGIAMAIVVLIFGQVAHGSVWYGINLLGGAGILQGSNLTTAHLDAFMPLQFIIALVIHAAASLVMGLVYGAMLPMIPSRPILLGCIAAPLIWSGLLYGAMGILNPAMGAHISWPWFIVSQIAYGLTAGFMVSRDERFQRLRKMPFIIRAGVEAPGLMHENHQGEGH